MRESRDKMRSNLLKLKSRIIDTSTLLTLYQKSQADIKKHVSDLAQAKAETADISAKLDRACHDARELRANLSKAEADIGAAKKNWRSEEGSLKGEKVALEKQVARQLSELECVRREADDRASACVQAEVSLKTAQMHLQNERNKLMLLGKEKQDLQTALNLVQERSKYLEEELRRSREEDNLSKKLQSSALKPSLSVDPLMEEKYHAEVQAHRSTLRRAETLEQELEVERRRVVLLEQQLKASVRSADDMDSEKLLSPVENRSVIGSPDCTRTPPASVLVELHPRDECDKSRACSRSGEIEDRVAVLERAMLSLQDRIQKKGKKKHKRKEKEKDSLTLNAILRKPSSSQHARHPLASPGPSKPPASLNILGNKFSPSLGNNSEVESENDASCRTPHNPHRKRRRISHADETSLAIVSYETRPASAQPDTPAQLHRPPPTIATESAILSTSSLHSQSPQLSDAQPLSRKRGRPVGSRNKPKGSSARSSTGEHQTSKLKRLRQQQQKSSGKASHSEPAVSKKMPVLAQKDSLAELLDSIPDSHGTVVTTEMQTHAIHVVGGEGEGQGEDSMSVCMALPTVAWLPGEDSVAYIRRRLNEIWNSKGSCAKSQLRRVAKEFGQPGNIARESDFVWEVEAALNDIAAAKSLTVPEIHQRAQSIGALLAAMARPYSKCQADCAWVPSGAEQAVVRFSEAALRRLAIKVVDKCSSIHSNPERIHRRTLAYSSAFAESCRRLKEYGRFQTLIYDLLREQSQIDISLLSHICSCWPQAVQWREHSELTGKFLCRSMNALVLWKLQTNYMTGKDVAAVEGSSECKLVSYKQLESCGWVTPATLEVVGEDLHLDGLVGELLASIFQGPQQQKKDDEEQNDSITGHSIEGKVFEAIKALELISVHKDDVWTATLLRQLLEHYEGLRQVEDRSNLGNESMPSKVRPLGSILLAVGHVGGVWLARAGTISDEGLEVGLTAVALLRSLSSSLASDISFVDQCCGVEALLLCAPHHATMCGVAEKALNNWITNLPHQYRTSLADNSSLVHMLSQLVAAKPRPCVPFLTSLR